MKLPHRILPKAPLAKALAILTPISDGLYRTKMQCPPYAQVVLAKRPYGACQQATTDVKTVTAASIHMALGFNGGVVRTFDAQRGAPIETSMTTLRLRKKILWGLLPTPCRQHAATFHIQNIKYKAQACPRLVLRQRGQRDNAPSSEPVQTRGISSPSMAGRAYSSLITGASVIVST